MMDHQEETLQNSARMQQEGKSIILLLYATRTGKTVTVVSDANAFGKRIMLLVHHSELVERAIKTFEQNWPKVTEAHLTVDEIKKDSKHILDVLK